MVLLSAICGADGHAGFVEDRGAGAELFWAVREGVLWAVLVHIVLLFCLYLVPKYVLRTPIVDDFDRIKQHEDQIALDQLPDAMRELQKPKAAPKPLTKPLIDKQTLDDS